MEFKKYYKEVMQETDGLLLFRTETYIRLLWEEDTPIERAIAAIKRGNE